MSPNFHTIVNASFNSSFAMHRIINTWILSLLVLLIYTSTTQIATGSSDYDDFFHKCPPSTCSKDGPQVRFPYRLSTSPHPPCGAVGMSLSCLGNDTILQLPNVGSCKVQDINYESGYITVELGEGFSLCAYEKLSAINFTSAVYGLPWPYTESMNLISCTDQVNKSSYPESYYGPVPCLGNSSQFAYFLDGDDIIDYLPSFCTVMQNNITFPVSYLSTKEIESKSNDSVYVSLTWSVPGITKRCIECETSGKYCASTKSFCPRHSPNLKLIAIASTTMIVLLFFGAVPCFYYTRLSRKEHLRQEKLLAMYSKTATRYTFSEIKKMTKQFKDKLGQGGYGSVFKGELPNGIHVAVKVLKRSNTNSDNRDFINEVATIGTIHHFNVVRLLGFSSEGSKCALVYEFMPNGSLDKYISSKNRCNAGDEMPQMEIFLKIASGVASGIKYLHEGCIQRILHFDIKPHNILLDHNLNPKIADFGLAKFCSIEQSNVTVTAAKGTIGYMAPEVYSRNFGNVSYKSDVYSFGMLILKMVVGEKNLIPDLESNSEVYYPEIIYEKLVKGEELESFTEVEPTEVEIKKKLIIVAFWCIQWNPEERPHMTKVVQMLGSNLQNLEIPPKPFVS